MIDRLERLANGGLKFSACKADHWYCHQDIRKDFPKLIKGIRQMKEVMQEVVDRGHANEDNIEDMKILIARFEG